MRDPDLVMQAEQAAMALERAWRHWRRRHGLPAESMLPVSSYVGYSPAEPWGQPRVVFGMAADDAAALTLLLEGHDCVGPVHAKVASLPGAQPGDPSATLPVPRQDVQGVTARRRPDRLRPPRRPDPLDPAQVVEFADPHASRRHGSAGDGADERRVAGRSPAEVADDQDGPVFRQLAAAQAMSAPRLVLAGSQAGDPGQARPGQVGSGQAGSGQAGSGQVAADEEAQEADREHDPELTPRAGQDKGTAGFRPIGRFPLPGEPAVPSQRAANGSPVAAGASGPADDEPPGPLALAAAAARAAAEARIKAARPDPGAGGLAHPYNANWPAPGRSRNGGPGQHEAEIYAQPRGTRSGPEPEFRPLPAAAPGLPLPVAASRTLPPVIRHPEAASGAGTAQPGPLASFLEQGPESSDFFD